MGNVFVLIHGCSSIQFPTDEKFGAYAGREMPISYGQKNNEVYVRETRSKLDLTGVPR